MKDIQLTHLHEIYEKLQHIHGDKTLHPVYGAWCIHRPNIFLLFMNPTGKNVSCTKDWKGIRAPWLWTKNIWKLLTSIWTITKKTFDHIQNLKSHKRTDEFALDVYHEIAGTKVYISNLAKCTQTDARPLPDKVFKEYLDLIYEEIAITKPKHIITFGNQVSSIVLDKKITISTYTGSEHEILKIKDKKYKVYPTFYPVGQGMRNLPNAITRIKNIIIENW